MLSSINILRLRRGENRNELNERPSVVSGNGLKVSGTGGVVFAVV